MRLKTLFLVLLCSVCTFPVRAQVTLPSFFSDNMVLQRDTPLLIHGTANGQELMRRLKSTLKGKSERP